MTSFNSNLEVNETIAPQPMADIESSTDNYASRFAGSVGKWLLSVQERIVRSRLTAPSQSTILDVGGGHAQLANPLAADGFQVTVAGSAQSCALRLDPSLLGKSLHFKLSNLLHLPYPDKSFDTVLSFRLISHCENWPELVRELCRVARRAVIIDFPPRQSTNILYPLLFSLKKRMEGNTRNFLVFSDKEIVEAFRINGFIPTYRTGQFFLPMVIHRALKSPLVSKILEFPWKLLGLTKRFGSPIIIEMRRQ